MDYKSYFAYEKIPSLSDEEFESVLNEISILEAENYLISIGQEPSNIYFKLLAHSILLEEHKIENKEKIAYLNYLIAYYIGLFYHPNQSDILALSYLDKALHFTSDDRLKTKCEALQAMIKEETLEK